MKMDDFELWLKVCEENNTMIFKLPETGLYETYGEHMVGNNVIRDTPVYHVWKKGKRIYCGLNYIEAVEKARDEKC